MKVQKSQTKKMLCTKSKSLPKRHSTSLLRKSLGIDKTGLAKPKGPNKFGFTLEHKHICTVNCRQQHAITSEKQF